jgi:hypothetical protein
MLFVPTDKIQVQSKDTSVLAMMLLPTSQQEGIATNPIKDIIWISRFIIIIITKYWTTLIIETRQNQNKKRKRRRTSEF